MTMEQALPDFQFIEALPGKKILLKGNHDFWWSTAKKAYSFLKRTICTPWTFSIITATSTAIMHLRYARLVYERPKARRTTGRSCCARSAVWRRRSRRRGTGRSSSFCTTRRSISAYECPEILDLLDAYHVPLCCYGHIHSRGCRSAFQGMYHDTEFRLLSADYISFCPRRILP